MRNIIIKGIALGAVAVSMAACDENAWNDKLDGFEVPAITDKQTIEYTLTAADYAAIASNATNKALAADDDAAKALAAVGSQRCFSDLATPAMYAPAFLASSSFPYFTLSDGSAVKLTYNVAVGLPPEAAKLAAADQMTVSDADYQLYVWESEDDYIDAFAPSKQPASYINKMLKDYYDDAESGDYVIVNYEMATQEPIFGNAGGGDQPGTPAFELSSVIGTMEKGQSVDVNAVVTAICTRGIVVTDKTGSVLVYKSGFDYESYAIGDQLVINATVSSYGTGFQLDGSSAEIEKVGNSAYAYPAPQVYTGADMDQAVTRAGDYLAVYCQFTGTASVGNYINFAIDGAETAQGSAYYITDDLKAQLADGQAYAISGYFSSVSSNRYFNVIVTSIAPAAAKAPAKAPAAAVPTTNVNAVYSYNGTKWTEVSGVAILQAADYAAMGQTYGNLSNSQPDELLPIYLKGKYPYAQDGDNKLVLYKYYSGGATAYACDSYAYDGAAWVKDNGIAQETAQFVRNAGVWNYDPSVTIDLPAGKGVEISTTYYQACVDWVFENIDKPLGSTDIKSGKYYISSYGNNEYYAGTSAYQNDVDLRASAARTQYPEAFADMTDEQVVESMKLHFAYEVMPGALAALHPDAAPVPGIDVVYTINFVTYNGSNSNETIRFRVTAPGQFEFIDCTWWEGGKPAE